MLPLYDANLDTQAYNSKVVEKIYRVEGAAYLTLFKFFSP